MINLLVFVYLFTAASFDFYLINFYLKYIPGNVFTNTIVASVSSSIASFISGFIVTKLGSACSMSITFGLCAIAGIVLFVVESSSSSSAESPSQLIPVAVLAA